MIDLELPEETQARTMAEALKRITTSTNFIVFDPKATKETVEDERRTIRLPTKAPKKVYAKLDDYSGLSDEELIEWAGTTEYKRYVTFMLAEEY